MIMVIKCKNKTFTFKQYDKANYDANCIGNLMSQFFVKIDEVQQIVAFNFDSRVFFKAIQYWNFST